MRLAFFGDVIGRSGREGLGEHLPRLRRELRLDFVAINAENAAAGREDAPVCSYTHDRAET